MERNLFDWSAWDLVTNTLLQFYGCVLKVPVGSFEAGDKVPVIIIDFKAGILQLYEKGQCGSGALISEHTVRMVLND